MKSGILTPWLRWSITVLATIEAIDAIVFVSQSGGTGANPWLLALTAAGVVGVALVWLADVVPGPEWLWLGVGALLVAAAPAILYPLSALLFVAGVAVLVMGSAHRHRATVVA